MNGRTGYSREPLAVVGIGLRFPSDLSTPTELWGALLDGRDALSDVPADRFDIERFHDPDLAKAGKVRSRRGGFVSGPDKFDADFFGYFAAEAARIDPQQRFALEVAYHALEDSGTPLEKVAGTRTSVFVGSFMYDHLCIQTSPLQRDRISPHVAMGVSNTSIANRISHRFDLRGPSVTLDTACSSSLVAIHLACRSIWAGEADAALAGGVNLILRPESSILLSKAGFLSPDGKCKAFDVSANGYVRSEGVGIVYIKPLSRAVADGDRIYALVRGSATNQDGYTHEGFTVPSGPAQKAMLRAAYADAGVDPTWVSYVEAHGPGTVVGDPIETGALGEVLGKERQAHESLWIGSIKTNLGHLEGASGVAGFIKAVLVAQHRRVPQNLHFVNPNPAIDFAGLKLSVPTTTVELPQGASPIWVGVNSFGAGGTNAHVVLESAPVTRASGDEAGAPRAFVLSARGDAALKQAARDLADHVRSAKPNLVDVAYTLDERRSRLQNVLIVSARDGEELCARLEAFAGGAAALDGVQSFHRPTTKPAKIAFAFSGQGGQWATMGRALASEEPVFAEALAEFDAIFERRAGFSIRREIEKADGDSRLDDTVIVQPAIAAMQIALARLFAHYGLVPDAVVGHSIGEVAAAHVAGALTLEQAVAVIRGRSVIQDRASGVGRMLAVGLTVEEAERMIAPLRGAVEIATINGPKAITLAGDSEPLEAIAKQLEESGAFARFVSVKVPYHSRFMDPLEQDLVKDLSPFTGQTASRDLYSTVTASREPGTHLTGRYWFENVRYPVRYVDTAKRMIEDGCDLFVEIGPHPVLVSGTREVASGAGKHVPVLPAMTKKQAARDTIALVLGAARAAGRDDVSAIALHGGTGSFTSLPRYPFQEQRYWFETPEAMRARTGKIPHPLVAGRQDLADDGRAIFDVVLDTAQTPSLVDHRVDDAIVFPATGHIEVAHAVGAQIAPYADRFLEDLRFESPVVLTSGDEVAPKVRLEITSAEGDYVIMTRPAAAADGDAWTRCSRGRINTFGDQHPTRAPKRAEVEARVTAGAKLDVDAFYANIRAAGLTYGDAFRCVRELWHRDDEIVARLDVPPALVFESPRFLVHPALLDACIHTVFADVHRRGDPSYVYLPQRIERVRMRKPAPRGPVLAYVHVRGHDETFLRSDTYVYDEAGELVVEVIGMTCKRIAGEHRSDRTRVAYETQMVPAPIASEALVPATDVLRWVVLATSGSYRSVATAAQRAFPDARGIVYVPATHPNVDLSGLRAKAGGAYEVRAYAPSGPVGELFADVPLDRRTQVILAADLPKEDDRASAASLADALRPSIATLLALGRELVARDGVPAVTVVTREGCTAGDDRGLDPIASSLQAAARVFANELPNVRLRVVDLPRDDGETISDALAAEIATSRADRQDTVVALRAGGRFARRVAMIDTSEAERALAKEVPARGGTYRFVPDGSATLGGVVARRTEHRAPGPNEVLIEVCAAALNFKDVMNAMSLLSERAVSGGLAGQRLGLECAGVVLAVGKDVRDVGPGDRVMARVADGFAGRVLTPSDCVVKMPPSLGFAEAASVPVVYVTAHYGLSHLARLEKGESVLIHSGAGGVGIAAIRLAKRLGARVFTTAGSRERREWLKALRVDGAFDSRSLSFYDEVMAATGGRGVDVVLNSLTGRLLVQSIKCLAPFGRFVEIGKTDIYRDARIGLERFGENLSFFAVDVDRLAAQKPAAHRMVLTEVAEMFQRGELAPHPVTEYPVRELGSALNLLSRATATGKVAVVMDDQAVMALPPAQITAKPDRSYMITGGAGGFGLEVARMLATRGARHLVLVSRSGPKREDDAKAIRRLAEEGVTIRLENVDVSDETAVEAMFERLRAAPPLAGIVHSAAVLDDARIADVTPERFHGVFAPKALGAWNLHRATVGRGLELEFFVMLSSVSSVLGLFGQIAYAASNQFLDALAAKRAAAGLPGLAVNLGVLGEYAGMSRRSDATTGVLDILETNGLPPMTLPEALRGLEMAIVHGTAQRMTAVVDWSRFIKAYPHLERDGAFLELAKQVQSPKGGARGQGLRETIVALPVPEQAPFLAARLRAELAKILGSDPDKIPLDERIDRFALDSLTLTQLRSFILREMEVSYPLIRLMKGPSLTEIAVDLLGDPVRRSSMPPAAALIASMRPRSGAPRSGASVAERSMSEISPWLLRGATSGDEPMRLVCFHSMGVGASLFAPFLVEPPDGIDVIAVQTPGRETRANEPVLTNVNDIVTGALSALEPLLDRPFAVWGHSFGGVVAFEAIRALRRRRIRMPAHFMVTGTIAPQLVKLWQRRDVMLRVTVEDNSPEYLLSLARYVDDPDFVRSILPMMRRDAPLLLGYRYVEEEPLPVPVTAFAARQDDMVYPDEIAPWSAQTRAGFQLIEVDGDHWFLHRNRQLLRSTLGSFADSTESR